MKKMFTFAAMACVALASCTKNESVEVPQQDVITFAEPVTALNTKAVEIQGVYPTAENFSVFAHYFTAEEGGYTKFEYGDLYMNNVKTAYDADLDGWDSKKAGGVNYYWPKQGTLTFAAYSPTKAQEDMKEGAGLSYTASGFVFENFKVQPEAENQYDLLFSERAYNKTNSDIAMGNDYVGIQLQFNHALSSILFYAKTDINYADDNFYIYLNKVELQNICSTGSFNQGLGDAPSAVTAASDVYKGWSGLGNATTYTAYTGDEVLGNTSKVVPGISPADNYAQNSHLILLPQDLTNARLYVEYTIGNGNTNVKITQNATMNLKTTEVAEWIRGKRYIYNLTFGLDKIYFDPVVTNWEKVEAGTLTAGNSNQTL